MVSKRTIQKNQGFATDPIQNGLEKILDLSHTQSNHRVFIVVYRAHADITKGKGLEIPSETSLFIMASAWSRFFGGPVPYEKEPDDDDLSEGSSPLMTSDVRVFSFFAFMNLCS